MKTLSQLMAAALLVRVNGFTVSNDIVRQAAEKELAAKQERAIEVVRTNISYATANLNSAAMELRNLRKREKVQKEFVKKLDRAVRFFLETGNPLPYFFARNNQSDCRYFCADIGIEMPEWKAENEAYQIPADWKPAETADVPAAE